MQCAKKIAEINEKTMPRNPLSEETTEIKLQIDLLQAPLSSYNSFFEYITQDCPSAEYTYISWECSSKSSLCEHDIRRWKTRSDILHAIGYENVTVLLQHFEKTSVQKKDGSFMKRLIPVTTHANINFITTFIENILLLLLP